MCKISFWLWFAVILWNVKKQFVHSTNPQKQNLANFACLSHGGSMGWLSPSMLVLQSNETTLVNGPISNETASWIGSATYIGAFLGNFMFMAILKYFGRKKTFCILTLPNLVSWIVANLKKFVNIRGKGNLWNCVKFCSRRSRAFLSFGPRKSDKVTYDDWWN